MATRTSRSSVRPTLRASKRRVYWTTALCLSGLLVVGLSTSTLVAPLLTDDKPKISAVDSGAETPISEPIEYEGQLGRVKATAPAGIHHIGDGYAVRITHVHNGILAISMLHDERWNETRAGALDSSHTRQRVSKFQPVGHVEHVNLPTLPVGLMGSHALEWQLPDQIIHVHIGTPGVDAFLQSTRATRSLFVGRGGDDKVHVFANPDSFKSSNHVLINGDGHVVKDCFEFKPYGPVGLSNHDVAYRQPPEAIKKGE